MYFPQGGVKIKKSSFYHLLNQKQQMCTLSTMIAERKISTSRYMLHFSNEMPTML